MEVVFLTCLYAAFALTVIAAPPYTESEEAQLPKQYPEDYQYLREPRSNFAPQYVMPCAAAAAAAAAANSLHLPSYSTPYNLNANRYPVPNYGYSGPHYRSVDEQLMDPEMLAFSDVDQIPRGQAMMDHNAMARFSGILPSVTHPGLAVHGPVFTPAAAGSAYGIFPNANVGGCSVPLLLSCSPSITSGHMAQSTGYSSQGIVDSYRLAEEPIHHEQALHTHPEHVEETLDQQSGSVHKTSNVQQNRA